MNLTPVYTLHHYLKDAGVKPIPKGLPDFPMTLEPRPAQITGLNMVLSHPRFGLFDDAGVGKTLVMQAYALTYIAWGNKAVCTMPPTLLDQFTQTMQENYKGVERWLSWKIIDRPPYVRQKWFNQWDKENSWPSVLLMTYEMFEILKETLRQKEYLVLITDEAQKLRGSTSSIHATVMNYTADENESALLLATGTPLHNTPVDGFAMTRLTNRDAYSTLEGFKRRHCEMKRYRIKKKVRGRTGKIILKQIPIEEITGYKNLDQLNSNLYKNARRVEKSEVLSLEEPTIIPSTIYMKPPHRKIYELLAEQKMLEIGENRVVTATESSQLREHLMGIAFNPSAYSEQPIENAAFEHVLTLLDSFGSDTKVMMYAHHNAAIEALSEYLEDKLDTERYREPPVVIYGGSKSSSTLNRISVKRFKEDPRVKLGIAHHQAGGVGLDLQHVSHTFIIVEPCLTHGDFTQVLARFQRSGQKHPVTGYILKIAGTVYPKMVEDMLDNNDLASTVNCDVTSLRRWITGDTNSPF